MLHFIFMADSVEEVVDSGGSVVDVEEEDPTERGGTLRKTVESMLKMGRNLEMTNRVKGAGTIYHKVVCYRTIKLLYIGI